VGVQATFRRGVSIPPIRFRYLISNTQLGREKFPAVLTYLDPRRAKKLAEDGHSVCSLSLCAAHVRDGWRDLRDERLGPLEFEITCGLG